MPSKKEEKLNTTKESIISSAVNLYYHNAVETIIQGSKEQFSLEEEEDRDIFQSVIRECLNKSGLDDVIRNVLNDYETQWKKSLPKSNTKKDTRRKVGSNLNGYNLFVRQVLNDTTYQQYYGLDGETQTQRMRQVGKIWKNLSKEESLAWTNYAKEIRQYKEANDKNPNQTEYAEPTPPSVHRKNDIDNDKEINNEIV